MPEREPSNSSTAMLEGEANAVAKARYRDCKACALRGFLLLFLGSLLLLVCKLAVPELLGTVCAYAGGVVILVGNFYILFGLLIYADSRSP